MTKQNPDGRYEVYSVEAYRDYPNVVPAGRYTLLRDAISHAESVTCRMAVVDSLSECRGFIYCNWELIPRSSPWGLVQHHRYLDEGIWSVSTSSHGGIRLSDERLSQLTEILGYEYQTFCGDPHWFEEDCDWCVPAVAFNLRHYTPACEQLRGMVTLGDKYRKVCAALVAAGKMPATDKVKQDETCRFHEEDCGGVFDGFSVTSDADSGL